MTLYHWALVDKKGKTRMTCEAPDSVNANDILRKRRKQPFPIGWQVVDRGSVKSEAKPEPGTKPEPIPFKVGDMVEGVLLGDYIKKSGKFLGFDEEGDGMIEYDCGIDWPWFVSKDTLKLIEPAPDPPTPEELLAEAISQSTKLAAQFQEALGMPEASWPDMVAEAKALSQFKAVHQSNTAAKLDKIKAALMGYDAAKLGGDAYSVVERFI